MIPHLLKSRMQVATAFHEHLAVVRRTGAKGRMPRGAGTLFLRGWNWGPHMSRFTDNQKLQTVRRWHRAYMRSSSHQALGDAQWDAQWHKLASFASKTKRQWGARKRAVGAGRPRLCPWLDQALYEWWSSIRHSVDWTAIRKSCPAVAWLPKKIARFSQAMLTMKAKELISEYCSASLKQGAVARPPVLCTRWWGRWRRQFGLSMRHPNRKYKVPLAVLEERLCRGWLNVFRVRAAAHFLLGQDLEMENFDQSPFHHNETGSASSKTLAVAGVTVPLVEGHCDTRKRWTANFTTFSDKDRLRRDGPPYMECMFRAEGGGEKMLPKLEAHLRERGYGAWVSVATSQKGSYKTNDVLAFLTRHLPKMPAPPQSRPWRIMMADDHAPHLSPLVSKLCWSLGYVFIPHGGGVTSVVQTVDTDLNQHAKRKYMGVEGAALLRKMQLGQIVPQLRAEECVDIMVEVMSDMSLHLAAADGYLRTGFKANLFDAHLDQEICKEAGHFWRKLNMRDKVASAVAEVEEEWREGRLRWCYQDIMRLILPHPRGLPCDLVLANLGEDTALDPGDAYLPEFGEGVGDGCPGDQGDSSEGDDEGWGDERDLEEWAASGKDLPAPAEKCPGGVELPGGLSEEDAARARECSDLSRTYDAMAAELRAWGDLAGAAFLEQQRDRERRAARSLCRENPGVMHALLDLDEKRKEAERQTKRMHDDAAALKMRVHGLASDVKKARQALKDNQARLADADAALALKEHFRSFGPEELGKGRRSCGGPSGRKARTEVLRRMSELGHGLSREQRADFPWFCESWDQAGVEDFGDSWPETFCVWLQNVLREHESGAGSAFSLFVHSETRRRLAGAVALVIPPTR